MTKREGVTMGKYFLSLAAVTAFAWCGSASRADFNMPPAPKSGQYAGPVSTVGQYGWNPVLKKIMWWKKDDCDGGKGGRACAGGPGGAGGAGMGPPGTPGNMTGTLVFPVNPFVRSPRDFFMYGQGGN
jgi:hypothetical protein